MNSITESSSNYDNLERMSTHELLEGVFGVHAPSYSWVLRENVRDIGACFWPKADIGDYE